MSTYPAWCFDNSVIEDPHGRAEKLLRFAALLRHPKSDEPDNRLVLTRWQRRILARIVGPSNDRGGRAVKTVYILIGRGNRKTTLASVIALAHLMGPLQSPSGQLVLAASERTQARLAFDEMANMVRLHPTLAAAARIRDTKSVLEHPKSRSSCVAISADGDAQLGKTPSLAIIDEIAVQKGYTLWNALKTGLNKVPNSLCVILTTAGERPEGIGWELYQYARKVALGEIVDPTFLPVLFEGDPADDWDSEAPLLAANPGLIEGGFPDRQAIEDDKRMARQLPAVRRGIETFHLNRWQDGSVAGWVDLAAWDACAVPIDAAMFEGRECYVGVDLSKSYDLTAIVAAFPDDDGGLTLLHWAFCPADTIAKRATQTDQPWREWAKAGSVTATPGAVIDESAVEKRLRELCERFDVQEIAFDPALAARLMARLYDDGLPAVSHPQSPLAMTPGVNAFQRRILAGTLRHAGDPLFRWNVANIVPVANDTGLVRFSKGKSTGSIDIAQAAAMAIGRAEAGGKTTSVYDTDARPDGLLFLN